jgi:outer membrane protein
MICAVRKESAHFMRISYSEMNDNCKKTRIFPEFLNSKHGIIFATSYCLFQAIYNLMSRRYLEMKQFWWILFATLVAASTASAQTALTIDQAVDMALKQNLSLQRDRMTLETSKRAFNNSWNTCLPSVTVSAGALRANSSTESFANSLTAYGSLGLSLSFSLSAMENVNKIRLNYESGIITYKQAERALELSVRKAYYGLLLADDSVRLAEQNIQREQKNLEQTEQKYKAGLVPDIDLFSARVSREKLTPKLESAQTSRANIMDSFKLLLGIDISESVALSGDLGETAKSVKPDPAKTAVKEAEGRETLMVLSLEKSIQIAESSKKAKEKDSFLPLLTVDLYTTPEYFRWFSGGSYTDIGALTVGFSLPLDTFIPGSSAKTAIAEYDDLIRKLKNQHSETKISAGIAARSGLRSIQTAISSLAALDGNAALAQKTYDLTYEAYQKGYKALSDVTSAASTLDEAKNNVLSEAYTLMSAILDLEDALDIPFGTLAR